jgi:hypothetical protein
MKPFTARKQDEFLAGMAKNGIAGNIPESAGLGVRDTYHLLLESPDSPAGRQASQQFLKEQLEQARRIPHDFPAGPQALASWIEHKAVEVGKRYAEYLEARKQGEPRRYFSGRAHALSFLQQVAPTKLVDGAWLYGLLPYWRDLRFQDLIRTYLEELGDGVPDQNHAVLYKRLLAENGCETLPPLSEEHYVQGALQLAFASNAEHFLPELIGYNLGYEQLPLHLLITAFELGELDIDPYYFTLHVTIDNAGTGHARRAAQALKDCMPVAGDSQAFWQRVIQGYQLNDVGLSTEDVIRGFDLERELELMLERKRVFGQHVHSDFSLIGGHSVNEWLSAPQQMKKFLEALEAKHWILRHQDPRQSRFWRLIDGPKAPMAGVFDGYEKQLLHDWIAGEWLDPEPASPRKVFRRYRDAAAPELPDAQYRVGLQDDMDQDVNDLRRTLLSLAGAPRAQHLIYFMSPSRHTTPAGLLATREFSTLLNNRVS